MKPRHVCRIAMAIISLLLAAGVAAQTLPTTTAGTEPASTGQLVRALHGLHAALLAQGKTTPAAAIEHRFKAAWADADVALEASRIMPRRPAAAHVAAVLD